MKNKITRSILFIIAGFFLLNNSFATESKRDSAKVYKVNYWVTGSIDAVGVASALIAMKTIYKKSDLTPADLLTLNKNNFSKFDQRAFKQDPTKVNIWETNSYYAIGGTIALPLLLGFDKKINKQWKDIALMYLEMHMITLAIYDWSPMGPSFVNKYRPMVYYDQLTYDQKKSGLNKCGFYSGHVSTTVASTFFMVKVYSDYHPQIGWKKYLLYAVATLPGLWVADMRVKALKHFPSDNMVGLGMGMICGIAVPALHKIKNKNISLSLFSNNGASGLTINWKPDL